MKKITEYIFLCLIVPISLNIIIYFGFTSQYTGNVFSKDTFLKQYNNGIYKYRFFSKILLLDTYKAINTLHDETEPKKFIKFLDEQGTNNFYASYFILNTFFSILLAIIIYYCIFNSHYFNFSGYYEKVISFLFINLIMYVSEYVIVPYDFSGYTFFIISSILTLAYIKQNNILLMAIICLILIISTLNRETSYISLTFFTTLIVTEKGIKNNIFKLLIPILCFTGTYLGLRIYMGFENGILEKIINNFEINVLIINLFILVFCIGLSYIAFRMTSNKMNKRKMMIFLLLNTPYILTCLLGGRWFELRLFIPLYLGLIFLSKLDIHYLNDVSHTINLSTNK